MAQRASTGVPPLACAIADNADASNSAGRFLQMMACQLLILSVALLLWRGMADSPIDFRSKLKPLPPVSLNAILDTHEQHDTSGSHHGSDHGKHGPVENSGDHLSHAERVARFQHLKSILEPFKHSSDAAEALSKKQVKVQRPEGRPAKPRKVSILAEGAQQVVYDPSFEAKMKRFLARTKEFFSPNSENSFFAVFGKGSAQEAEQSAFNFVMLICTVYALYVPDIYIASYTAPGSDVVIFTITNFVLFLFFIEFAYYSLFKKDYFNSFFFWLDLVSTASLIPDALDLYGKGLQAPEDEFTSSAGSALAQASIVRAGRAARAGTRAARVVRIFKLISILLQKSRERNAKKKQKADYMDRDTKIGAIIGDGISRKVILIVAGMIIGSNLIELIGNQDVFSGPMIRDYDQNLENLELMLTLSGGSIYASPFRPSVIRFIDTINANVDQVSTDLKKCPAGSDYMSVRKSMSTGDCGLRYLRVNGIEIWGSHKDSYAGMRLGSNQETEFVVGMNKSEAAVGTFMVLASRDQPAKSSASNCITVTFIIVVLSVSTMLMNKDTEELIVGPIKEMCFSINSLIENPLVKLELDKGVVSAETQMIASSMMNLSGMLQVALGQAGITIIRNFLMGSGDPNQLTSQGGTRVQAIFAFCDIHHFSEQTVALQEDIMLLVNKVSVIVHTAAAENEGFINKNIGDCFLLAWRLPEFRSVNIKVTAADSALRSAIRTILEVKSDAELHQLTIRESVQQRVPGYRIKMGFGLHAGYGIEGAIGSSKKIDASYLSPNVNLASRLEYACKQYDVWILMSDAFFEYLSDDVRALCRLVDKCTVKGSVAPMSFYTFDVNPYPILPTLPKNGTFWDLFPPTTTVEYRQKFGTGVQAYLDGQWSEARQILTECQRVLPHDGPTKTLISTMSKSNFQAPRQWRGYRELTSK